MASKVYFSREISAEKVLDMYKLLGVQLEGRVAVKVHSGERGNQNFLRPEFWKAVVEHVDGTVVETNTAYEGSRHNTAVHQQLMKDHGWTQYFPVDILDGEGPDTVLEIPDGLKIKKNYIGKDTAHTCT